MPTHHPKIDLPYPVDVGTGRRPQRESVLTPPRQAYSYILRPAGGGQIIRGSSQSDESQLRLRALSSRPPIVGSEAATKGTRLLNTAATKGTQPCACRCRKRKLPTCLVRLSTAPPSAFLGMSLTPMALVVLLPHPLTARRLASRLPLVRSRGRKWASGHAKQNIPVAGTNHGGGERIYAGRAPITEGERIYAGRAPITEGERIYA
eukprot:1192313-Prorocentrum_minimum.AAC.1